MSSLGFTGCSIWLPWAHKYYSISIQWCLIVINEHVRFTTKALNLHITLQLWNSVIQDHFTITNIIADFWAHKYKKTDIIVAILVKKWKNLTSCERFFEVKGGTWYFVSQAHNTYNVLCAEQALNTSYMPTRIILEIEIPLQSIQLLQKYNFSYARYTCTWHQ